MSISTYCLECKYAFLQRLVVRFHAALFVPTIFVAELYAIYQKSFDKGYIPEDWTQFPETYFKTK